MVGFVATKEQYDNTITTLLKGLEDSLSRCSKFKAFLDTIPDVDLQAAPYNYTAAEVARMKSAFNDAAALENVYRGLAAVAVAKDHRQFIKLLLGFNL